MGYEYDNMAYVIKDAETGIVITGFDALEEAKEELACFELNDKADGTYMPGSYTIVRNDSKRNITNQ